MSDSPAMKEKRRYSSVDDPTKERIIKAALECISHTSFKDLSVRTIATTAGVNVATVHYYFGTKDTILGAAMECFLPQVAALFEKNMDTDLPPRQRLTNFLFDYVGLFQEHPGLFASVMEAIIDLNLKQRSDQPANWETLLVSMISQLKPRAIAMIREISGIQDDQALTLRMMQVMCSLLHPLLMSGFSQQLLGLNLRDEALRRQYINQVVDSAL